MHKFTKSIFGKASVMLLALLLALGSIPLVLGMDGIDESDVFDNDEVIIDDDAICDEDADEDDSFIIEDEDDVTGDENPADIDVEDEADTGEEEEPVSDDDSGIETGDTEETSDDALSQEDADTAGDDAGMSDEEAVISDMVIIDDTADAGVADDGPEITELYFSLGALNEPWEANEEMTLFADPVCEIDGTGFATFAEALEEAMKGGNKTIKLLENINHSYLVVKNESFTIDLNGFELTLVSLGFYQAAIEIENNTLTIAGSGTLTVKGTGIGIKCVDNGKLLVPGAATVNVTVEGPVDPSGPNHYGIYAENAAVINGAVNVDVTVNGVSSTHTYAYGIYAESYSVVNTVGNITSKSAVTASSFFIVTLGIFAEDNSTVTVNGSITASNAIVNTSGISYGINLNDSSVNITGSITVTAAGIGSMGVQAGDGSSVDAGGNVSVNAPGSFGISAQKSTVNIGGNLTNTGTGVSIGAYVYAGEITIGGDITTTGGNSIGAHAGDDVSDGSGEITVDGKINVPDGAAYVSFCDYNDSDNHKDFEDFEDESTKAGYREYTDDGSNFVWVKAIYKINVVSPVTGGTAAANKTEAKMGDTINLTATPADGYEFASWGVSPLTVVWATSGGSTEAYTSFTMPDGDITVTPAFKETEDDDDDDEYEINLEQSEGGSAEVSKTKAKYGDEITIIAIPDEGYVFVKWHISEVPFKDGYDETTETAVFEMPGGAVEVKPEFKKIEQPETQPPYVKELKNGLKITVEGLPWGVMIIVLDPDNMADAEDYARFENTFKLLYEGKMIIIVMDIFLVEQDDDGNPKLDENGNYIPYVHDGELILTLTIEGDALKGLTGELILHEKKDLSLEEIEHTYDAAAGKLVFKAKDFSLYGIVADDPDYVPPSDDPPAPPSDDPPVPPSDDPPVPPSDDPPVPPSDDPPVPPSDDPPAPPPEDPPARTRSNVMPATGIEDYTTLWISLLVLSLMLGAGIMIILKRAGNGKMKAKISRSERGRK